MTPVEKRTLLISGAALIISILNTALTSPVLIDIYAPPRLTATEEQRQLDGDTFRTTFVVRNSGISGAKSVEVVLMTHAKDIIQVSNDVSAKVEEKPNGPPLKVVRVKLDYMAPNEDFGITVTGAKARLIEDAGNYYISDRSPLNKATPEITGLRSEKGLGTFSNQPAWYFVNAPTVK